MRHSTTRSSTTEFNYGCRRIRRNGHVALARVARLSREVAVPVTRRLVRVYIGSYSVLAFEMSGNVDLTVLEISACHLFAGLMPS